jgi:8-oxo-dGTP pyrophosphatase MutT (NUDIX family)
MPHIHDKIDFTSEVFIVYKNKVLLRKHDKYQIWLSVGGHIELDEDPNEAAVREIREEIGLNIELYRPIGMPSFTGTQFRELIRPIFMNRHRINEHHEHVTQVYFARAETDKICPSSEKEVSEECRWFAFEELDNPDYLINEPIRYYAKKALEFLAS